ncbi:hypothetical protein MTO96_037885, partial [Rhipicephalus appendiculatus]
KVDTLGPSRGVAGLAVDAFRSCLSDLESEVRLRAS